MNEKFTVAERFAGATNNVWVEFRKLSDETRSLNLGQGFPDFPPPDHVQTALREATAENHMLNQYTRSFGHLRLVQAISKVYSERLGRQIDPMNEVLVSIGAYGSLYYATQGLLNPGDEVIILEPFFDCYEPMVKFTGAIPRFVPFRPPTGTKPGDRVLSSDWKWDPKELEAAFNSKTKLFILNTPNNPLGKVLDQEELELIAKLCKKHNVVVLSDEVYEYLIYPPAKHIRIATLPDMWERTISVFSSGKIFSVTGWKLGFAVGPANLITCMQQVHQNCVYVCPTPLQEAVARGLEHEFELEKKNSPDCYFKSLAREIEPKRDRLAKCVQELGMIPTVPQGGYFLLADFSHLNIRLDDEPPNEQGEQKPFDYRFIYWMAKNKRLSAIPPTAFYSREHRHVAEKFIRFCFIKKEETLDVAEDILRKWHQELEQSHKQT